MPKKHYKDLDDIPMYVLSHILEIAKKIKPILEEKLKPESIILIQNNGEAEKIKHFHLHLIPNYKEKSVLTKEEVYSLLKENSDEI